MHGEDFKPGTVFKDGRIWVRVRSRGPVITRLKGHEGSVVKLVTEDRDGNLIGKSLVYADKDYDTRSEFPGARGRHHKHDATNVMPAKPDDGSRPGDEPPFTDEELAAIPKVVKHEYLFSDKDKGK